MTLTDLWNDPEKMAAFMGWPFEDDEVQERASWTGHLTTRSRTAIQATMERLDNWCRSQGANQKDRPYLNYVQECARESLGITGRTQAEIVAKCVAARPDLFSLDGDFKPVNGCAPKLKRMET